MALVVDKAELIIEELFRGLRESSVTQYLALLGGSTLLYIGGRFLFDLLNGLRIHFLSKLCSLDLKKEFGEWAVVTGCTNGIGRAISIELASKGLNIALIARNPQYLEELSKYLEAEYKIQTIVIVADFKDAGIYEQIKEKLEPIGKDFGILYNNVGMADERLRYHAQVPDSLIRDMINTNMCSVALMSNIALDHMEKRGRGAIVNVSSVAGVVPFPLMSIYSSTKAFVNHFSLNIHHEYASKGITVQNLTPMGVRTKMLKDIASGDEDMINNFMTPSPDAYARNAIRSLGKTRETTGYWLHSLNKWVIDFIPQNILGYIVFYSMKSRLQARGKKLD